MQDYLEMKVIDAEKFLKENFEFIKHDSLEGCSSALVWLPKESEIWNTYGSRMECPWKLCLGRRKGWGLAEAVLRHSSIVKSALFSPDGRYIVSTSYDYTARIWNTATGDCQAELKGHSMGVISAVFSPDGKHIVSASDDCTARIWNIATGDCQVELTGHSDMVNSAVFSPDGRHIVSASDDYTARIWNTATGDCKAELKGHSDIVNSAIFSPDGRHIVSASYDHTVRIWNTASGDCKAELKDHSVFINSTILSSHGVFLSHGSYPGQIHLLLQSLFLDIYQDTITHTKNLQKIWVPPPFCNPLHISHHMSKICLAYGSGELLILEVCNIHKYIQIVLDIFLQI